MFLLRCISSFICASSMSRTAKAQEPPQVRSSTIRLPSLLVLQVAFTRKQRALAGPAPTYQVDTLSKYRSFEPNDTRHLNNIRGRKIVGDQKPPNLTNKTTGDVALLTSSDSDSVSSDSLMSEGGRILASPNPFRPPPIAKVDTSGHLAATLAKGIATVRREHWALKRQEHSNQEASDKNEGVDTPETLTFVEELSGALDAIDRINSCT